VSKNDAYPLESVDRALRLLTLLQAGQSLTVTGAAKHLDVVPSTAHRLLGALVRRDYATRDERRGYVGGPALGSRQQHITLGSLSAAAAPFLQEMQAAFDETAHVMVLQGRLIRFVDGMESSKALRVSVRSGGTMPAHSSAGGKAMLAALTTQEIEERYRDGLPPWPTAKVTSLLALHRELNGVRERGYGINVEETEQGVSGVAAAVLTPGGRPVAALTFAVPSSRFSQFGHVELGRVTMQSAARLTAALQERL
jgi:IclR family acetate operon transcriptional repressor